MKIRDLFRPSWKVPPVVDTAELELYKSEVRRLQVRALLREIRESQGGQLDSSQPKQGNSAVVAAIIGGAATTFAAVIAMVGAINAQKEPVKPDCAIVLDHYAGLAKGNPQMGAILTVRPVGSTKRKSIVEADSDAVRCNITPSVVLDLSQLPK